MKSKIVTLTQVEKPLSYPRLMRSSLTGIIALFVNEYNGVFVHIPKVHSHNNLIGKDITTDPKSSIYWKDFTGKIELSN